MLTEQLHWPMSLKIIRAPVNYSPTASAWQRLFLIWSCTLRLGEQVNQSSAIRLWTHPRAPGRKRFLTASQSRHSAF